MSSWSLGMAVPHKIMSFFDGTFILVKTVSFTVEIHGNEDNADLVFPYISGCHMQH